MSTAALIAIIIAVPLLCIVIEWLGDTDITERHHAHHDTYLVPRSVTTALMLMAVFVGMLGLAVGWLCSVGVFAADASILYGFFAAFLIATFSMWLGIRRYRVITFEDRLQVRPFVGPAITLRYADITNIYMVRRSFLSSYRNMRVCAGKRSVTIWGVLNLEQILSRIDRFDTLEGMAP